jgi:hypothetical protein
MNTTRRRTTLGGTPASPLLDDGTISPLATTIPQLQLVVNGTDDMISDFTLAGFRYRVPEATGPAGNDTILTHGSISRIPQISPDFTGHL